ncbi:MAG: helix-turn-helix domain containing protein [Oscillospiraceae bacterium]|nr:helix-turn-helix domain containing protein [Oscillospiraceae bacterium]
MQSDKREIDRAVCAVICRRDGLRAREIAKELGLDHETVNRVLYGSPLMKELCWQDRDYRWHGLVKQERPHRGLEEFAGYYGTAAEFCALSESAWMDRLTEGCGNIGRSLSDSRGLLHSFRDCREQLLRLFEDLASMLGERCLSWEIACELRLKRARRVRLYADVLVITEDKVFSLEFKMKDTIDPEEVRQAARYCPYLEILFGPAYEVIPVLVLTRAHELFTFVPIDGEDRLLPVCAGDMLFNVFDEYLGFLQS